MDNKKNKTKGNLIITSTSTIILLALMFFKISGTTKATYSKELVCINEISSYESINEYQTSIEAENACQEKLNGFTGNMECIIEQTEEYSVEDKVFLTQEEIENYCSESLMEECIYDIINTYSYRINGSFYFNEDCN